MPQWLFFRIFSQLKLATCCKARIFRLACVPGLGA
jgi:hypothetical protein